MPVIKRKVSIVIWLAKNIKPRRDVKNFIKSRGFTNVI